MCLDDKASSVSWEWFQKCIIPGLYVNTEKNGKIPSYSNYFVARSPEDKQSQARKSGT